MKALVIKPKDLSELKFISDLMKKLGVGTSTLSQKDLEDIDLTQLLKEFDKTKKVPRSEIMKKLTRE